MTDDDSKMVLVAFPVAESMRTYMRAAMPEMVLPSLYRTGAKNMPCSECGMTLNVGPRLQGALHKDATAKLVCPFSLLYVTKDADTIRTLELGNPEAGWDGERRQ